ncbi:MAG: hypothetical protein ACQEVA_12740 [Myxococcota bacterium]
MTRFAVVWSLVCLLLVPSAALAQSEESAATESEESKVSAKFVGELGFLDPLFHKVQFGSNGTYFDYVDEGGQDVLFSFARLSAELGFGDHHKAIFLYQPLRIESEVLLERDIVVDNQAFAAGTPMKLTYGFPFYRASYLYDFWEESDRELAIGASLQLRNATINFASADGELLRTNRDVGPVPIIKVRYRQPFAEKWWFGFEADGFYAPIKYLNGGDSDVTGAILDSSVRVGYDLSDEIGGFANFRYLAGGGEGTSNDDEGPGDGFTKNWLHFATVSLGFSYSL